MWRVVTKYLVLSNIPEVERSALKFQNNWTFLDEIFSEKMQKGGFHGTILFQMVVSYLWFFSLYMKIKIDKNSC